MRTILFVLCLVLPASAAPAPFRLLRSPEPAITIPGDAKPQPPQNGPDWPTAWRSRPGRSTLYWQDRRWLGYWCDDPDCTHCRGRVYGR